MIPSAYAIFTQQRNLQAACRAQRTRKKKLESRICELSFFEHGMFFFFRQPDRCLSSAPGSECGVGTGECGEDRPGKWPSVFGLEGR
jgi:hypothetical protein